MLPSRLRGWRENKVTRKRYSYAPFWFASNTGPRAPSGLRFVAVYRQGGKRQVRLAYGLRGSSSFNGSRIVPKSHKSKITSFLHGFAIKLDSRRTLVVLLSRVSK